MEEPSKLPGRTLSPSTSPLGRKDGATALDKLDTTNHIPSPLRQENGTSDATPETSQKPTNGTLPPPLTVQSPNGTVLVDEFPFAAPPGAAGETPTNDLARALLGGHGGDGAVDIRHSNSSIATAEADDIPTDLVASMTAGPASKKPTGTSGPEDEVETPTRRRSVQFARDNTSTWESGGAGHSRDVSRDNWHGSNNNEADSPGRADNKDWQSSGQRLTSKLRALTTQFKHSRTMSGWTVGSSSAGGVGHQYYEGSTPQSERAEPTYGIEDSEADADAEESGAEGIEGSGARGGMAGRRPLKATRRKSSRMEGGTQTAPTTPRSFKMPSFMRDGSPVTAMSSNATGGGYGNSSSHAGNALRPGVKRRATMTDMPEAQSRAGVSEDEGRDRLARGFRRTMTGVRGASSGGNRRPGDGRKPSNLRRITGLVGGGQDGSGSGALVAQRQRLDGSGRQATFGTQRWQQLKLGLKTFMRQEKLRIDHVKSAELMAELMAGAPAALILASMFQRDEEHNRRIPVLLEQLKVRIVENRKVGERHHVFKIELEYGNGLTRMKWVIYRTVGEFLQLNTSYARRNLNQRLLLRKDGRAKKPHFPWDVFPYLRGARGLLGADSDDDDEEEERPSTAATPGYSSAGAGSLLRPPAAEAERPATAGNADSGTDGGKQTRPTMNKKRQQSSMAWLRSISNNDPQVFGHSRRLGSTAGLTTEERERNYSEMQRKSLENYLQKMISAFMFRADSNRLCKFLELSALGIRLGAEGGYHGKEGMLLIKSSKGRDFRRQWKPRLLTERHSPKWFIVRHSYIICVTSPEEMNIYDVLLLDPEFSVQKKTSQRQDDDTMQDLAKQKTKKAATKAAHPKFHHQLEITNSERSIKLLGRTKETIQQFYQSITFIQEHSLWGRSHRFGSFAPLRRGVFARWLVDGRDYMWQVSKAISRATDVIYIHDWWLSPELYLRRPPAISQKWRLDRLLQRKAREGVKVFVIVYRNINSAIPIDSEYSKFSLLDLHPNVFVQRSPNQFRQNTFFWSHHEKICVIDHNVAFCGGVDLCFGRWDTPEHTLVDDKNTGFELNSEPKDADHVQLWPGKDYSNPRVQDFYALDKPYEEMYDRSKIPRMPWHDIGMQIVGQPARDLTRHFVQRWNFILRQRNPSRPTPFLLPPPDFSSEDLTALDMDGTCEIQILRSSCEWSLGIRKPEHSIMNAYVKLIEQSEHFVYMENQFFITSCTVQGTRVENLIGDALVERIIRAHTEGTEWRAVIVIPLMPGYQSTVDSQEGSSVRLIMTCQYRSICRGPGSIFERLRAHGIEPSEYIEFYALRQWGKIGPKKVMVTEQLYIHAKVMVVDDRAAIIGSANINERSLLGTRDSEIAAVVRDTDMIDSKMGGQPYKVGRFPHTLRMRLMREHLGVDVDAVAEEDRLAEEEAAAAAAFARSENTPAASGPTSPLSPLSAFSSLRSPLGDRTTETQLIESHHRLQDELIDQAEKMHSYNHDAEEHDPAKMRKRKTVDSRVTRNAKHEADVMGAGPDNMLMLEAAEGDEGRDTKIVNGREYLLNPAKLEHDRLRHAIRTNSAIAADNRPASAVSTPEIAPLPPPTVPRMITHALGLPTLSTLPQLPSLDDTDIGAPPLQRFLSHDIQDEVLAPLIAGLRRPWIHQDCMQDPIADTFFYDTWHQVAENNTRLYRQVFRCQPDNEVKTWKDYREYVAFGERFSMRQGAGKSTAHVQQDISGVSGPPGTQMLGPLEKVGGLLGMVKPHASTSHHAQGKVDEWTADQEKPVEGGAGTGTGEYRAPSVEEHEEYDEKTGGLKGRSPSKKNKTSNEDGTAKTDSGASALANGSMTEKHEPITMDGGHAIHDSPEMLPHSPTSSEAAPKPTGRERTVTISEPGNAGGSQKGRRQRRRGTTRSSVRAGGGSLGGDDSMLEPVQAEQLLDMVQGTLVVFPYDWLEREEHGGNWLYTVDQLAPLDIYT